MLLYCRKYLLFISRKSREILKTEVDLFGFQIHKYGDTLKITLKKTYNISKESKGKNKKTFSDKSLKEFNNLKKEFEGHQHTLSKIEQLQTSYINGHGQIKDKSVLFIQLINLHQS
ncbi:hypothetical protein ACTFIW_000107 [Dictyostelium discoideum]